MIEELKKQLLNALEHAILDTYGSVEFPTLLLALPPRPDMGDFTFGAFHLAKLLRKSPALIARELAPAITLPELDSVDAAGPYINFRLNPTVLFKAVLLAVLQAPHDCPYGFNHTHTGKTVVVEYSSPNTNKPLHIGHVRNNVLGHSACQLLEATGHKVIKACLVNDRGVHICKSMLAYERFFPGQTPESRAQKGDHFAGDCYVAFAKAAKEEATALATQRQPAGRGRERLKDPQLQTSELEQAIRSMLLKWEANDPEIRALWHKMNQWVYEGFAQTYQRLGISFDTYYYESELYEKGRQIVLEALRSGKVERREDGSIVINLDEDKLDPKVLLRKDGTTLYITQDIGVAVQKYEDFQAQRSIYVVGNEQDHQMKVLFMIMKKLGYEWSGGMYHLSYGMVNLPDGKMKSREGNVVDADELMDEMFRQAREKTLEVAQQDPRHKPLSETELQERSRAIGLGAIKFYMLKINPRKDFVFNPEESIQLQGDTGPYVQYTHARICSILRKAKKIEADPDEARLEAAFSSLGNPEERGLIRQLIDFPKVVTDAAERLLPSTIASYLLEFASVFNKFYHDHSVLSADNEATRIGRLVLCAACRRVLSNGLGLLGIEAPETM